MCHWLAAMQPSVVDRQGPARTTLSLRHCAPRTMLSSKFPFLPIHYLVLEDKDCFPCSLVFAFAKPVVPHCARRDLRESRRQKLAHFRPGQSQTQGALLGVSETHLPRWLRTGSDSGGSSIVTATSASSHPELTGWRPWGSPPPDCLAKDARRAALCLPSSFPPEDSVQQFFKNWNLIWTLSSAKYKLAWARKAC